MKNITLQSERFELVIVSPDLCIFLEALEQLGKEDKIRAMMFICKLLRDAKEAHGENYG